MVIEKITKIVSEPIKTKSGYGGNRPGGREMELRRAQEILTHLIKNNYEFCFLVTGELITREDCWNVIRNKMAI